MAETPSQNSIFRFGLYELEGDTGELRKDGKARPTPSASTARTFTCVTRSSGTGRHARGTAPAALAGGHLCGLRPQPECCCEQTARSSERHRRKSSLHPDDSPARLPVHRVSGSSERRAEHGARLATTASFAAPEIKLGWIGGGGQSVLLAHNVGPGNAALMLLTGDPVDAATALRWGLVTEVLAPDALLPRARELAGIVASRAPIAAETAKPNLRAAFEMPLERVSTTSGGCRPSASARPTRPRAGPLSPSTGNRRSRDGRGQR